MNKITITYYGDEPPVIECSDADRERIVLVDGEEALWLYMEHKSVKVYRTEKYPGNFSDYWYSVYRGQSTDAMEPFDVRDLTKPPVEDCQRLRNDFGADNDKVRIAYAIEQGKITEGGLLEDKG